jgi:hypothetical protein
MKAINGKTMITEERKETFDISRAIDNGLLRSTRMAFDVHDTCRLFHELVEFFICLHCFSTIIAKNEKSSSIHVNTQDQPGGKNIKLSTVKNKNKKIKKRKK